MANSMQHSEDGSDLVEGPADRSFKERLGGALHAQAIALIEDRALRHFNAIYVTQDRQAEIGRLHEALVSKDPKKAIELRLEKLTPSFDMTHKRERLEAYAGALREVNIANKAVQQERS